jgi:hypothetical protein
MAAIPMRRDTSLSFMVILNGVFENLYYKKKHLVILNFTVPSRFSHEKYLGSEFVCIDLPLILKI